MARGLLAIGWLALLAASTTPERIANALARLRLPGAFVTIGWLTYRYLRVLAEEGKSLVRAWYLRRIVPRRLGDVRALSGIVGVLFVRALERAERVHQAMQMRGFTGQPPVAAVPPLRARDLIAAALAVCGGVCLILVAR